MIGALDPNHKRVTVVGAGISGLLAAYHLDRRGLEVTLLEASDRAGGLIQTRQAEWGMAETAAHSTLATAPVLDLFEELGLQLHPIAPDSRARYILRNGKMRKFPLTFGETLGVIGKVLFAAAPARPEGTQELTLADWARTHLGDAALTHLLTPFTSGVFGATPGELAVDTAFPMLSVPPGRSFLGAQFSKQKDPAKLEEKRRLKTRENGTLVKKKAMMAPEGGMGALIAKLEARLVERLGSRFCKGVKLENLPFDAPNLMLCVPAHEAARLLEAAQPELAQSLRKIRYTPMVTVTTFVEKQALSRPRKGVGVLMSGSEKRDVLGVLFNSSSFPGRVKDPSSWESFTVMMGGVARADLLDRNDDEIRAIIRREFEDLFGLRREGRLECVIQRWHGAIPHYNSELAQTWKTARTTWCAKPGQVLFGNYTGQVSLRGMIETARFI